MIMLETRPHGRVSLFQLCNAGAREDAQGTERISGICVSSELVYNFYVYLGVR